MGKWCVDCNTEYFNGKAWVPMYKYSDNDNVLQFNVETGEATLVKPSKYVKIPCEELYFFQDTKLCQSLSEDHRVIFYENEEFDVQNMAKVYDMHTNGEFKGKFRTTFKYAGPGINMSNEEIITRSKEFDFIPEMYNCNEEQLALIFNELANGIPVVTTEFIANFIQFVFSTHDCGCYITERRGEYSIEVYARGYTTLEDSTIIYKVESPDGFKYCFSVPNRALVLRKNGKIFITASV